MRSFLQLIVLMIIWNDVTSDVYLHVPRGSNNRLNEKSANRNNADRLFDSQNNNRGGYNVGDKTDQASGGNAENQYSMKYFMSSAKYKTLGDGAGQSKLTIEWTNQHGCGDNKDKDSHKVNCDVIIQYMCQEDVNQAAGTQQTKDTTIRNGVNTGRNNYQQGQREENRNQANNRKNNVDINKGLHEPWQWYDKCNRRERNKGLFTADQNLKNNNGLGISAAIYTRQNPNGNRRGYECPEERDYYPYWHPTPWKDIAVLTHNDTKCKQLQEQSFNTKSYHECVENWPGGQRKWYSKHNNAADCQANGGTWTLLHNYLEKRPDLTSQGACQRKTANGVRFKWAVPFDTEDGASECLVLLDAPECTSAPWTRDNHLGNSRDGLASHYTWTLPYFPSGDDQRCVLRIRYNISTADYNPTTTDSSSNGDEVISQNPLVDIGENMTPLRLAINTAQYGRTFQDRSHVFKLRPRPNEAGDARIFNLNVRGKRGNIVQTYPAVEYDFAPNTLEMDEGDLVQIQWTGSNTHNNQNPAGDGQAGDAGEGKGGTDRSNLVQAPSLTDNYPLPFESTTMWQDADVIWIYHGKNIRRPEDIAISMASSGYYMCVAASGCPAANESAERKNALNNLLNNAPASYEGALIRFKRGEFTFISTRNNNFSNRSQKGKIVVR